MIDVCFNPKCAKQLHYLRDGRVVRIMRERQGTPVVEHFWLCGECYPHYRFEFPIEGSPALIAEANSDRWVFAP